MKNCLISDKHPWNNVKALRSTKSSSRRPICDPDFALFLVCVMMLLTRCVVMLCKKKRDVIGISLVAFSSKQESSYDFGGDNFLLLLEGIVSCVHVVRRRRP